MDTSRGEGQNNAWAAPSRFKENPPQWAPPFFICIGITCLTFLSYLPAMNGGFIWDDDLHVSMNPLLADLGGLWRIWFSLESQQYYPLVYTTFWLENHLWGLNTIGYHLVNISLHSANAVLVWLIMRRLGVRGAWMIGAIFAVHPVHVESVAWISERKNVLSGLLYLLSFLSYLEFSDKREWRWWWLSLLAFTLGLLCKTVICTLPAAILLVLWMRNRGPDIKDVLRLMPFFVLGLIMGLVTVWWEINQVGAVSGELVSGLSTRLVLAGRVVWFYLGKLLFPASLTFIYPEWDIDATEVFQWLPLLGAAAAMAALFCFRERLGRAPLTAFVFFIITLFPALGFFDIFPFRYSFVADHFQYLASIGPLALGVGTGFWASQKLFRGKAALSNVLATALLTTLSVLTWNQSHVYTNLETLWKDTIKKNPTAWMAHNNLGTYYLDRARYKAAIELYRRALEIRPDYVEARYNLGIALQSNAQTDEAIEQLSEVLRTKTRKIPYAKALCRLGLALSDKARHDEAISTCTQAVRISPLSGEIHNNLAIILANAGKQDKAIEHLHRALSLEPSNPTFRQNLDIITNTREHDRHR